MSSSKVLQALKDQGGALIGYFPIGYPSLEESIECAVAMVEEGVDIVELGIPYSDPVMDGVVIQQATEQALERGFRLTDTFEAIKQIRARVSAPILVMTYWNPVLQFGVERFAAELARSGASGAITPDLIPDEAAEWIAVTDRLDLDRVFLATPSSSDERTKSACDCSRGFVYAVSTMGTTGTRDDLDSKAKSVVARVRKQSPKSLTAVGLGISTAQQVREVNKYADGAIVGSAFIKSYRDGGLLQLRHTVKSLAEGK